MNKEQIDEIAMRVWNESVSECDSRTGRMIITEFTHALLAELAKVQDPVAYYSAHRLIPDGTTEFYGYTDTKLQPGTPLYLQPLPQPDLVAEIERLKQRHEASDGITKMQISELRQQLSAAQNSDEHNFNRWQAAQASYGELLSALKRCTKAYSPSHVGQIVYDAIATHKARKEESE